MTNDEYMRRIERIPLTIQRETSDGDGYICRSQTGAVVRVTKPEFFRSDADRAAALEFIEMMHSPRSGKH